MAAAWWLRETWRWALAGAAAAVAVFVVIYLSLFMLFWGPFPKDLAEPTAGFLMGSVVVAAGAILAPRHQLVTAIVLGALDIALGALLLHVHVIGIVVGAVAAVVAIAWWVHPRRTPRATAWAGLAAGAAVLAFIGLVYARRVDWPPRPAPLPPELAYALGPEAPRVVAFYRYDLGGFIDREWLWRIDTKPDVVARLVRGLELQGASAVPPRFWRMPPHYWPRSMPAGGESFQSRAFSADTRGSDGEHYFVVHDRTHGRAYVWLKSNF